MNINVPCPCPTCGRCPTCGQPQQFAPWPPNLYPYMPQPVPQWPPPDVYPVWIGDTTGTFTISPTGYEYAYNTTGASSS